MKLRLLAMCCLGLLCACVSRHPDSFYVLTARPVDADSRPTLTTQVTLHVTLPSLVDRGEMVINTSADGVLVLEHQRWAAPLTDEVSRTLSQDIERRRPNILVAGTGAGGSSAVTANLQVTVVQLSARPGDRVSMETHWRIRDVHTGKETLGAEVFSVPLEANNYAAVARGISACLDLLLSVARTLWV
jgi:uncharacterized protein